MVDPAAQWILQPSGVWWCVDCKLLFQIQIFIGRGQDKISYGCYPWSIIKYFDWHTGIYKFFVSCPVYIQEIWLQKYHILILHLPPTNCSILIKFFVFLRNYFFFINSISTCKMASLKVMTARKFSALVYKNLLTKNNLMRALWFLL